MKKYKFRLETLEKYRKVLEQEEKKAFSVIKKQVVDKESEIVFLGDEAERVAYVLANKGTGASVDELRQHMDYIGKLREKKELRQKELLKLQEEEKLKRLKLLKATGDRKVISRLREASWSQYLKEYNLEENKRMDDAAKTIFLRNKNEYD